MDFGITPRDLNASIVAGEPLVLLDVREGWEVEKAPFPGVLHIPMGDIPSRIHQEVDPDEHIIVICHHGVRSLNVTHWMRQAGMEKAQSLSGGIDSWSQMIDPTVPRY